MKGLKISFKSATEKVESKPSQPKVEETNESVLTKRKPKSWRKKQEEEPDAESQKNDPKDSFKYDFSGHSSNKDASKDTNKTLGFIKDEEDLMKVVDNIFKNLKEGNHEFAKNKIYQLDTNINSWMSNLSLETSNVYMAQGLVPGSATGGEGWVTTQRRDLEKYEDNDYKEFLKKLGQKNLAKKKRILSSCKFCLENTFLKDYEILALNQFVYVLQPFKTSFPGRHFVILPTSHTSSTIQLEREEYLEVRKMKNIIIEYLKTHRKLDSVSIETAFGFHKAPHCRIEVIGVEAEFMVQAPLFFDNAFQDLGDMWDTHKKGQYIKKSKGGILKQIPPNFEYCAVEWDDNEGMFNVVEDAKEFSRSFFYEVLGSMMDMDPMVAKAPKDVDEETMKKYKGAFRKVFKPMLEAYSS